MPSIELSKTTFLSLINKYNLANSGAQDGTPFDLSHTCIAIALNINTMLDSYLRNDTANMIIQKIPPRVSIKNNRVQAIFDEAIYQLLDFSHDLISHPAIKNYATIKDGKEFIKELKTHLTPVLSGTCNNEVAKKLASWAQGSQRLGIAFSHIQDYTG